MKKYWTFKVNIGDASLPELYITIDKEPELKDTEQRVITTYNIEDNDTEENIAFIKSLENMYFADWYFDPSITGTGYLRSATKQWRLIDIAPESIDSCQLDHSSSNKVEISITWKFQRTKLIKKM